MRLTVDRESGDQHWLVCDQCGSRWFGPFGQAETAVRWAQSANADPVGVRPPNRIRPAGAGPCCDQAAGNSIAAVALDVGAAADTVSRAALVAVVVLGMVVVNLAALPGRVLLFLMRLGPARAGALLLALAVAALAVFASAGSTASAVSYAPLGWAVLGIPLAFGALLLLAQRDRPPVAPFNSSPARLKVRDDAAGPVEQELDFEDFDTFDTWETR